MSGEKLKRRKKLRLAGYDYRSAGAYFITVCTHHRAPLFGEIISDPIVGATLCGRPHRPDLMINRWLRELENKFHGVTVDYFIIMPDHIHFILFLAGGHAGPPLQEVINWFKTMTTNAYIKSVKKGELPPFKTALWQRGYYEHVIRNESDLEEVRRYIEENPVRRWNKDRLQV